MKDKYITIEPYPKGEMIQVRYNQGNDEDKWYEREFLASTHHGVVCKCSAGDKYYTLWAEHRPIPKTVLCELPKEVVKTARSLVELVAFHGSAYDYREHYFANAITKAAKK